MPEQTNPERPAPARRRPPVRMPAYDASVPQVRRASRRHIGDFSRPYIPQKFELYSDAAQLFFERSYPRIDTAFYMICVVIPNFGLPDEGEKEQKALEELFQGIEAELDNVLKTCIAQLEQQNIPKEERMTSYDHKRVYDVPCRSPLAKRYLKLFSVYDRLVAHLDALWINGLLPHEMRRRIGNEWTRRLRNFTRVVENLRLDAMHRTRVHARQLDDERAQKGIEPAEEDISVAEKLDAIDKEEAVEVTHTDVDTTSEDRSPA